MNVLIVKNIAGEGPGTIEDHLRQERIAYTTVDLNRGDAAPDIAAFTHLIIMGGPMAVYEMDRYPFLNREALLIEHAIKANLHVLGICLGAQMIAHVLGARVYAGGAREIGWYSIGLTPEGFQDRLMQTLSVKGADKAEVFQWHGDTFDLPAGAVLLASSELFPHQAFRHGDRVYALQFHIEVTPPIVLEWLKDEKSIDLAAVRSTSDSIYGGYRERANCFYGRFFSSSS